MTVTRRGGREKRVLREVRPILKRATAFSASDRR